MCLEVGWLPGLAGGALMLALLPAHMLTAKCVKSNRTHILKHTDARVRLISEILQGIRVIKLYAWEQPIADKVMRARVGCCFCVAYMQQVVTHSRIRIAVMTSIHTPHGHTAPQRGSVGNHISHTLNMPIG